MMGQGYARLKAEEVMVITSACDFATRLAVFSLTAIRRATSRRLVVAGGIATQREVDSLDALGMDAVCRDGAVFRQDPGLKNVAFIRKAPNLFPGLTVIIRPAPRLYL
jgi:hypothetical protein